MIASSSSFDSPLGNCEICHVAAHGIHFGVTSCRACAAFFRRTIVKNRLKKYECRGKGQDCTIRLKDRFHCRLCRYNKCVLLGMTPDNVQFYRDPFPSSKTNETCAENEENAENATRKSLPSKRIIDMAEARSEICQILNSTPTHLSTTLQNRNTLEQMEYALSQCRRQQKPEKMMKVLRSLEILEMLKVVQQQMLVMAKWLSHFIHLQKLDTDEKYNFFKLVWNIWRRFERYEMSLQLFGNEAVTEKKFVLSDEFIICGKTFLDFSQVSSESNEILKNCFRDSWIKEFQKVAKPLLELKPTSTEMAFMLSELCWQIAGKDMQGKVLEVSEQVRDELGTNLHSYYQKSENQPNYAGRLIQLMKVVSSIIKSRSELKRTMELAHVFDVFHVKLSEPDLYDF